MGVSFVVVQVVFGFVLVGWLVAFFVVVLFCFSVLVLFVFNISHKREVLVSEAVFQSFTNLPSFNECRWSGMSSQDEILVY